MRLLTALAALLMLCVSSYAQEHGDPAHFWISANPEYKRVNGKGHCCGPSHCRVVPGDFLKARLNGDGEIAEWYVDQFAHTRYGVQRFFVGQPHALYESIDAQNWACVDEDGEVHCIFTKRTGA